MKPGRFRMQVDDELGSTALIVHAPHLDLVERMIVADLAKSAVAGLAGLPGVHGTEHARDLLLTALVRQCADQEAYERVARQRGLLL